MDPLQEPYETFERPGIVTAYPCGPESIFEGALVGLDPRGRLLPLTAHSEAIRFAGVAATSCSVRGEVEVVKSGTFVYRVPAGDEVETFWVGRIAWSHSDWVVGIEPGKGRSLPVGVILHAERTSTGHAGVRIRIDRYVM